MYLVEIASSERNLNPKTACLKRREEEKSEDLPGGRPMNVNAEDLAQGPMGGKVSIPDVYKYKQIYGGSYMSAYVLLNLLKELVIKSERSGSVVECLTRDRGAQGSSLTGITMFCPWARLLILAGSTQADPSFNN